MSHAVDALREEFEQLGVEKQATIEAIDERRSKLLEAIALLEGKGNVKPDKEPATPKAGPKPAEKTAERRSAATREGTVRVRASAYNRIPRARTERMCLEQALKRDKITADRIALDLTGGAEESEAFDYWRSSANTGLSDLAKRGILHKAPRDASTPGRSMFMYTLREDAREWAIKETEGSDHETRELKKLTRRAVKEEKAKGPNGSSTSSSESSRETESQRMPAFHVLEAVGETLKGWKGRRFRTKEMTEVSGKHSAAVTASLNYLRDLGLLENFQVEVDPKQYYGRTHVTEWERRGTDKALNDAINSARR